MSEQNLTPLFSGIRNNPKTEKVLTGIFNYTKNYVVPAAKSAVATMVVSIVIGEASRRIGSIIGVDVISEDGLNDLSEPNNPN